MVQKPKNSPISFHHITTVWCCQIKLANTGAEITSCLSYMHDSSGLLSEYLLKKKNCDF